MTTSKHISDTIKTLMLSHIYEQSDLLGRDLVTTSVLRGLLPSRLRSSGLRPPYFGNI